MERQDAHHPHVFDAIPTSLDRERVFKAAHVQPGTPDAAVLERLCDEAEAIARPKAITKLAYIDEKGTDFIVVDGIRFDSRILRVNVDEVYRVVPYVATCGVELEEWSRGLNDMLEQYWADVIKQMFVGQAVTALGSYAREDLGLGQSATMNPGSLPDWPLAQQKPLFDLLGDPTEAIGVTLTESFLMLPAKSVSGIHFPTDTDYRNCQLCPREDCPGRSSPYEPHLYEEKYQ